MKNECLFRDQYIVAMKTQCWGRYPSAIHGYESFEHMEQNFSVAGNSPVAKTANTCASCSSCTVKCSNFIDVQGRMTCLRDHLV